MRSTGEVMGVGENFGEAFAKAQLSAGTPLPDKGTVFISVNDRDKAAAVEVAQDVSPSSASNWSPRAAPPPLCKPPGLPCKTVFKVNEGRPNAVDLLKAGIADAGDLHHHRRPLLQRRESHPPQRRGLSRPLHHHHERRESRGRSHRLAPARSDSRLEPAGDPRQGW